LQRFLVLGDIAGLTQGMSGYLWYAAVSGTVWGGVAAVPFLVKHKNLSAKETPNMNAFKSLQKTASEAGYQNTPITPNISTAITR
jgi:hypothetical protein